MSEYAEGAISYLPGEPPEGPRVLREWKMRGETYRLVANGPKTVLELLATLSDAMGERPWLHRLTLPEPSQGIGDTHALMLLARELLEKEARP